MPRYSYEHNVLKRAWIGFWYNTWTRLFVVLFPSYFIGLIPFLLWIEVPAEYMNNTIVVIYCLVLLWAMLDNDFDNRQRLVDKRRYK